ncbi:prolyl oligopeptidase family serine peptidase [Nonomuraea sp. NBC_00507]|uniref:prolyl oligopeptidase family serine peptidase n=1 Tax=Nonomuraea sp. NBC_00507 TaxID=2976002 RepID=UPI002E197B2F
MRPYYPEARVVEAQEELAGVRIADPYRWLEGDTDEVRSWQHRQGELVESFVKDWPGAAWLREQVDRCTVARMGAVPRYAGGQWFRTQQVEGPSRVQAVVSQAPFGPGRVVFDPRTDNAGRPPYVSWISPSPDGRTLALGVCRDGSERNTIRLVDVDSGRELADAPAAELMDAWSGGAHWLPDSRGFFFSAADGGPTSGVQRVLLHVRVPEPATTVVDVPWLGEQDYRMVLVASDGRNAVAMERIMNPVPVAVAELPGTATLKWRPFITEIEGTVAGHPIGDHLVAVTDVDAPRGRVVAIPLDSPTPNDPSTWQELVAESDAIVRGVVPVGDLLYVNEFADTYARVRIVDRTGAPRGEVPLPGRGALDQQPFPFMALSPRGHPEEFVFAYSTLTESSGVYRHLPASDAVEVLAEPAVRLEGAVTEDRWATSADGTSVPYHVVRRADADADQVLPTLINAYGGYNVPWVPSFPGPMAAFVAAGGVLVHAHLRGGAEFGRAWWQAGRMRNKQNCYADLYAIAEDLIGTGTTTPELLAVTGGSNGGLMSGVALTQRPGLWSVVVPRVPFLDVLGACREGYGRMAVSLELGDITDPEDVLRLAALSPYHAIRPGTSYPAVFVVAGDTDPRCPPWHARKFVARLQAAQTGDAPILLRVWENAGHGWATDRAISIEENTEWLSFVMRWLNLTPEET